MELPSLNRRRLLLGLAAASSAAALPAAALAAAHAAPVTENAELLRLGDMLPAIAAEYHAAAEFERAVIARWNPRLPRAPEAICERHGRDSEIERDLAGRAIKSSEDRLIYVTPAEWFAHCRKSPERTLRRMRPRHPLSPEQIIEIKADLAEYRRLETIAVAYEAERARVVEASECAAAKDRRKGSLTAFGDLVRSIMAAPAESMAGVIVQAQAMEAWGRVPLIDQVLATVADKEGVWATRFAASVLRIASA